VLTSAGSLFLGVVAVGLAVGKQAEFEGAWLVKTHPDVSTTTPQVTELDRMGRQANIAAIVGGVGGGVLLGVGIALLALGARRHRVSTLARRPALSPRPLGVSLTWRF
ncbi:MAG TPA: hypothetical protein PKW35_24170, partial [Nannocystaceae bacterium]|nr:hypothetical protein [Nannocystaceae bacterium]